MPFTIKFGNFGFIFAIKGPKFRKKSDEIQKNMTQNKRQFFTFTLGRGYKVVNVLGHSSLILT